MEDRWIRSRLSDAVTVVSEALDDFALMRATDKLYEFVWTEFCDWWLEIAKPRLKAADPEARRTLADLLVAIVKLMHPFTPFITEEIHAQLVDAALADPASSLMATSWPTAPGRDETAERDMQLLMDVAREIRRMRQELGVPADKVAEQLFLQASGPDAQTLRTSSATIGLLTRTRSVSVTETRIEISGAASGVVGQTVVLLPLAGLLDLDKERARLAKEIEGSEAELRRLEGQLASEAFTSRAPKQVVDKLRNRLQEVTAQRQTLAQRLAQLG